MRVAVSIYVVNGSLRKFNGHLTRHGEVIECIGR